MDKNTYIAAVYRHVVIDLLFTNMLLIIMWTSIKRKSHDHSIKATTQIT